MIGAALGLIMGFSIGRFFTPDAYVNDWYGWVRNQLAHFAVMFLLLCIIAGGLAFFDAVPTQMALAVEGVAFSVVFQAQQYFAQGGTIADAVEDAFIMGGPGWAFPCLLLKVGPDNMPIIVSIEWVFVAAVATVAYGLYGIARRLQ